MTTTEKIKVMQAFEDGQAVQWRGRLSGAKWKDVGSPELSWNWEMNEYRIKPPDPKPLECWGNLFSGHIDTYLTKHTAKKEAGYGKPLRTVIHLREVTPQDEQDRKDAARYQRLKHMGYRSLHGYISADWDELIDKAMEEE